jgi:hypothetical protein
LTFTKVASDRGSFDREVRAYHELQATGLVPRLVRADAARLQLETEHVGRALAPDRDGLGDPLPREQWPALGAVFGAIEQLHALGWRHGDATCKNVCVDDAGRVRLIDLETTTPITELPPPGRRVGWHDGSVDDDFRVFAFHAWPPSVAGLDQALAMTDM